VRSLCLAIQLGSRISAQAATTHRAARQQFAALDWFCVAARAFADPDWLSFACLWRPAT
jgi:hypothetical protein